MNGNVWEWCNDSLATFIITGLDRNRILRGGGWKSQIDHCKIVKTWNHHNRKDLTGGVDLGFRVAHY